MSLKYHLIQRPNKHKDAPAGSKLYYGQIRVQNTTSFERLCETISAHSTASKGDVMLVIDGLLFVLKQNLVDGNVVQVGDFGNFRMVAGCTGTAKAEDFNTSLFKKGHIVFTPGSMLRNITASPKFEKIVSLTPSGGEVTDPDDKPDSI